MWVGAGDTIWVGDSSPWHYNLFTAEGEFVRQVTLSPQFPYESRAGGVLDNGYSVNSSVPWGLNRPDFSVADTLIVEGHDAHGQLVSTIARIPSTTRGQVSQGPPNFWLSTLFDAQAEVDAGGSTIALAHGMDTEIRVLDEEFNLRLIVRWTEPGREVTRADLHAWREDYNESREQPESYPWSAASDAMVSDERPVADLFPAISTVMVGRDGRIWVRQYDRPREGRGWLGFGPDGQFLCHLAQFPGSVREFGADYVLLIREDELGAETAQMYRLDLPMGVTF